MESYIDSNIFIYAFTDKGTKGESCRQLIARIKLGDLKAVTSALTFHECFFIIKRVVDLSAAMEFSGVFVGLPNLVIKSLDVNAILSSLGVIKQYGLEPADAIHLATAIDSGCETFFSFDADFKKVKELKVQEP